jgi:hypothetical protein
LLAGVGSYFVFSNAVSREGSGSQAGIHKPHDGGPSERKDGDRPVEIVEGPRPSPDKDRKDDQTPKHESTEIVKKGPDPRPSQKYGPPYDPDYVPSHDLLTDRFMELIDFQKAMDGPPLFLKLHELDQDGPRQKLLAELQKGGGFRMELPCTNGHKALERARGVLKADQIGLTLDPAAAARIKASAIALFLEDVTPEELTRLLQQLGAEDKKAPAKQFDRLLVQRMGEKDHKALERLLGVDPAPASPRATGPLGVDLTKPISEQTADKLQPRSDSSKPSVKPGQRLALVLPFLAGQSRASSAEVKRYLDGRKPARAGTLRALLILRDV